MATTMPVTGTPTMADDVRFLCDEMLVGLGRWLRIAGYDTAIADCGRRDRDLVEHAHAENRVLLTRDRRLVEIRRAKDRILRTGDEVSGVRSVREPTAPCRGGGQESGRCVSPQLYFAGLAAGSVRIWPKTTRDRTA